MKNDITEKHNQEIQKLKEEHQKAIEDLQRKYQKETKEQDVQTDKKKIIDKSLQTNIGKIKNILPPIIKQGAQRIKAPYSQIYKIRNYKFIMQSQNKKSPIEIQKELFLTKGTKVKYSNRENIKLTNKKLSLDKFK